MLVMQVNNLNRRVYINASLFQDFCASFQTLSTTYLTSEPVKRRRLVQTSCQTLFFLLGTVFLFHPVSKICSKSKIYVEQVVI